MKKLLLAIVALTLGLSASQVAAQGTLKDKFLDNFASAMVVEAVKNSSFITRAGGTCMVRVEFGKARCRFHALTEGHLWWRELRCLQTKLSRSLVKRIAPFR
jgi:hypothetical protein